MDKVVAEYEDEGLVGYLVILQDNLGNPPSLAFCKQWQAQNKPSLKVLIDPTLKTHIYGGKETSIVTNEEGHIVYKVHGDYHIQLEQVIVEELAKDWTP